MSYHPKPLPCDVSKFIQTRDDQQPEQKQESDPSLARDVPMEGVGGALQNIKKH